MKKLRQDIKNILSNQCLTSEEKLYLKEVFKNFNSKREIISRKPINHEYEETQCYGTGKIDAHS